MAADSPDADSHPAVEAFIAELKHWREVSGYSQKALASAVAYTASYVSKVEHGAVLPSRNFAQQADQRLSAGRAIIRRWKEMQQALGKGANSKPPAQEDPVDVQQPSRGSDLVVEHEHAQLAHIGTMFQSRVRRQLRNVGTQPVTRYLIRIAVDRHPGDPEKSNRLYREYPLTWEELGLSATCGNEPMAWRVKHDRDAFKEVWLLFENADGNFPLYPGETAWIEYLYTVSIDKWGPWWQRAVRLPTHQLSMVLDLPGDQQPIVWGLETSMAAEASPFPTPIAREEKDDRVQFSWSIDQPPVHARYRMEWKYKKPVDGEVEKQDKLSPSELMRSLDIVQEGDSSLVEVTRSFSLPDEAEDARRVVAQLVATLERVAHVHNFAKGIGLAAPQIGIGRSAAVVRTAEGQSITLLNPQIINESPETDEQYEGCLSFFDVRGMVSRPLTIEVEHQDIDGSLRITAFDRGEARLVHHEIDHLYGKLYRSRMRQGVEPVPVSQYRGTGQQWNYRPQADRAT